MIKCEQININKCPSCQEFRSHRCWIIIMKTEFERVINCEKESLKGRIVDYVKVNRQYTYASGVDPLFWVKQVVNLHYKEYLDIFNKIMLLI